MDESSHNETLNPDEEHESSAGPDGETQEMRALLERSQAAPEPSARDDRAAHAAKPMPESVKVAAVLAVVHGGLLLLNAVQVGRASGDMSKVPQSAIWLGVLIVLAGALAERQAWAWLAMTLLGGLVGVFNLMKVAAFAVYKAGGVAGDSQPFSPLLVGAAGVVILMAVVLLTMPGAKAAFGLTKNKPDRHL